MIKLVAAFILGIWCVQRMPILPSIELLVIATLFSTGVLIFYANNQSKISTKRKVDSNDLTRFFRKIMMGISVFILGVVWASSFALWRLSDALPVEWEREEVVVVGVVADVPEVNQARERFRFNVEKVITPEAIIPSHIGLNLYKNTYSYQRKPYEEDQGLAIEQQFNAGERWQISVKLKRPHGTLNPHGFDFGAWAMSENLRATGSVRIKSGVQKLDDLVWQPKYLIARFRATIKVQIKNALASKPYAGVIQALVIGDDSAIGAQTWQVLLRTGVTHLMSISGLHITMLSGLAFGLMYAIWRRMPTLVVRLPARKAATLAGVIIACLYAFIAGFSVPTQRTFYMLMVFGAALWSGRQLSIAQVLAIALLVVVLIDPWAVNAPGFWLSFGAVALISFALNGRVSEPHWLVSAVKTQWAVTIGMLPMLLMMFNQASIISPVANAIAIPVVSFIVTPLALLGSFLSIDFILNLSHIILDWLMRVLVWLDALPLSMWQQHAPPTWTLLPALLGALILLLPRGIPLKVFGLAAFTPMLFIIPARPALGDMKVTVLDVGQGLSVHVQTAKHDLIYDAGPKYNREADSGMRIIVPHLQGEGVKQLDGLVISHDDNDHSGGAASIMRMMPTTWLMSSFDYMGPSTQSTERLICTAGKQWVWDEVTFDVIYPTLTHVRSEKVKDNNKSCVIKVTSAAGSLLLTGDIQKPAERYLLENVELGILDSDVMTVPHHGSKTSSSIAFLNAVSPKISIATAGYLNRFGHPKPTIVERYQALESQIYQSAVHGAVIIDFKQQSLGSPNAKEITLNTWASIYQRYWLDSVKSQP